jgi:hypothetical protein
VAPPVALAALAPVAPDADEAGLAEDDGVDNGLVVGVAAAGVAAGAEGAAALVAPPRGAVDAPSI